MSGGLSAAHCEHGHYRGQNCRICGRGFDSKCLELAQHFFGDSDPRLREIAQAIQDLIEDFPATPQGKEP
jgi:hypothetical protein